MPVAETLRRELGWQWDALRAEWFKIVRRRMTWISIFVFCALILLFYVILWLRIREGPDLLRRNGFADWLALRVAMSYPSVVPYGLSLERFFATLVCAIFAGTMMGNEYDWRTVTVVTARGVRRSHFFIAKVIASVGFTVVAVLLGFLVASAASAWFTWLYGLPWGEFDAVDTILSFLRTVFVILPFVFFAMFFATVWKSAGPAVGAALGFFFVEGIFINLLSSARGWLQHVPAFFLNQNIDAVLRANGTLRDVGGPFLPSSSGPPEWRGFLVLGIWMVATVIWGFWRFTRRDIGD
jgi:ABC-type transport system involved in multi-copper enzyme maturation permease subunit